MRRRLLFILLVFVLSASSIIADNPPNFDNEQFYGTAVWEKSATAPSAVSVTVASTGVVYMSVIKNVVCGSRQCTGKYGYDKDNILRVQAQEEEELVFYLGVVEAKKVYYTAGEVVQLDLPEGGVVKASIGQAVINQTITNQTGVNQTVTGQTTGETTQTSTQGGGGQAGGQAGGVSTGGTSVVCVSSWTCSEWMSCSGGQEVRTCRDEHKCGTNLGKPIEKRSCVSVSEEITSYVPEQVQSYEPEVQQPTQEAVREEVQKAEFNWSYVIYGGIGLLVLIGIIAGGYWWVRSRNGGGEEGTFEELEGVYSSMEAKGLSDEEITAKLMEKGWNESLVKKFLKKR
ncbi:hypothetical protein HYX11_00965 [Candidatus Woesearchaeota archaeon]|nr:hypothetical protein [Candidatus Woesearchaeota archaeon]